MSVKKRGEELEELRGELASGELEEAPTAQDPSSPYRVTRWVSVGLAAIALVAIVVAIWSVVGTTPTPASAVSRTVVTLPHDQQLMTLSSTYPMALSPDGERLAYVALVDGERRLFVRDLDRFEARPIPGSDGCERPHRPGRRWSEPACQRHR